MKRVFLAINLPEEVKEELVKFQDTHKNFNVRWTKKDSLHITLFFIGSVEEKEIDDLTKELREIASRHNQFILYLNEITVGPDSPFRKPEMIWVRGPLKEELFNLYKEIGDLMGKKFKIFENRQFNLHITLARAKENLRKFKEEINLKFSVKSFELMESLLLKDGAEYRIIKRFILK